MTSTQVAEMKVDPNWTDYAYFAAIARAGGLQRAADALGVSAATLSRRMRAFEARLGCRLFVHGSEGYRLTAEGRALAQRTERMEAVAAEIARWRASESGPACVRISAGTWTARHLAQNMRDIWQPGADWLPEFVTCERGLDIARREVDVGIRNTRPTQAWLAGRRVADVRYATYASGADVTGWIGPALGAPDTPSARWLRDRHAHAFVTKANTPEIAAALAQAGIGRVVLPTFAGDVLPGLIRVTDEIAELRAEQWIVAHHESRFEPAIRAALDALAGFLSHPAERGAD